MLYNYKKDKIIQGNKKENKNRKSIKDIIQNIKNTINIAINKIKDIVSNIQNKYNNWYYTTDWKQAGHNTAKILLLIGKILKLIIMIILLLIPILFLLFIFIHIGLFISKWIFPLLPWFDWNWNKEFISNLPLVFQATHPLATLGMIAVALLLSISNIIVSNINTFFGFIGRLIINILQIMYLINLFTNPEIIIHWGGFVMLPALYLAMYLSTILDKMDLTGGSGIGDICFSSNNEYDEDEEDDDYVPTNSVQTESQRPVYTQEAKQPEITYKIINAKQIAHTVNVTVWEFRDGQKMGTGYVYGHAGILQNWNESFVVIKDGKCFRQYGLHGEIVNTWWER